MIPAQAAAAAAAALSLSLSHPPTPPPAEAAGLTNRRRTEESRRRRQARKEGSSAGRASGVDGEGEERKDHPAAAACSAFPKPPSLAARRLRGRKGGGAALAARARNGTAGLGWAASAWHRRGRTDDGSPVRSRDGRRRRRRRGALTDARWRPSSSVGSVPPTQLRAHSCSIQRAAAAAAAAVPRFPGRGRS